MPVVGNNKQGRKGRNKEANPNELDNLFKGIDFEIDFDTDDFDFGPEPTDRFTEITSQKDIRILRPRAEIIERHLLFENAEAFAEQVSLNKGDRTYAISSGNFIFGDFIEALVTKRNVTIKKLYIMSLSFSQDNIDSLKNIMLLMGDRLEKMVLIFSGYQYSHDKYTLVPYLYRELDEPGNRVQIAFGGWHGKVITIETCMGNYITIHGSANLRSSNSIEQIMFEVNNKELHDFNAEYMQHVADRFGTINHGAPYNKLKRLEYKQAWEISKMMAEKGGEK